MVLLHHAAISTNALVADVPLVVYDVLNRGYLGVDFFFVLSGFIIYYTTHRKKAAKVSSTQFAKSRLLRIMVPYLPVGIGMAILYTLLPALSDGGGRQWSWISTLTLLPSDGAPALNVAWTLQHELMFYGFYAVFFFSGRLLLGMALWMAGIITVSFVGPDLPPFLRTALAPINLEFSFGIVAAWLVLNDRVPHKAVALAGAGVCLAVWVAIGASRQQSWIAGLAIAAIVPMICRMDIEGRIRIPKVFVFLGAASYAIYLVHDPVLSVVSRGVAFAGVTNWPLGLLLASIAAAGAGVAYYIAYERQAVKIAKAITEFRGRGQPILPPDA